MTPETALLLMLLIAGLPMIALGMLYLLRAIWTRRDTKKRRKSKNV